MARQTILTMKQGTLGIRGARVRKNFLNIVQCAVAAGLAFWIAGDVVGNERPFFAPMAAVIILGLSSSGRIQRALEMSIGCCLGVGVGDLLFLNLGTGAWQIGIAVLFSLVLANFLSNSQLLVNQVAIGSILLATIIPPGTAATYARMIDAVIGCVVGIVVMALIPHTQLLHGRREVGRVLNIASSVLFDVSEALPKKDAAAIFDALVEIRGSQAAINAMQLEAKASMENTTVSPLLWGSRHRVRSFTRLLAPVDNTVRNTRVLARRAQVLAEDGDHVTAEQITIICQLSRITQRLAAVFNKDIDVSEAIAIPEIVKELKALGARCGLDVAQGGVLSAQVILAQSRSIIVDLLQVCGLSRESAVAALVPTSETPAYPPEVLDE